MSEENSAVQKDHAGVKIPPPLAFLGFSVIGVVLQSDWMDGYFTITGMSIAGLLIIIFGFVILLKGALGHKKAKTNIEPWKPTTSIISDGLYGYSRNPLYVAMAIVYLGIALAAGSYVALITLIPCMAIIRYHVIAREETYLDRKFGDEYITYKSKVRRWI